MSFAGAVLRDLAAAFAEVGVRWYLFGAQAAIVYGSTRVTEDIDVTVMLGSVTTTALVRALGDRAIRLRVSDGEAFAARARVLPFVHGPSGMPVDVVLAGPGLEEMFLERAVMHTRDRASFPVARAEDVIVMKVLADRPRDREDILAILRAAGRSLDVASIDETLRMVEEALGQSDLRPTFERLERESRRRKAGSKRARGRKPTR